MTKVKINSLIPISPDLELFNSLAAPFNVFGFETITERSLILFIEQDLTQEQVAQVIVGIKAKILDNLVKGEIVE